MKLVKLNATDSTNTYIKNLLRNGGVENWTIVTTEHQTEGKGQFDNKWVSEKSKNLTFSILVNFDNLKVTHQLYLNYCVSIAIYNVLRYYIPNKLSVKWPNDILSANHKVCGILIECLIKNTKVTHAIIGIGLNVNQDKFPTYVLNATSLKKILKKEIDRKDLLQKILLEIQYQLLSIQKSKFKQIKQEYESVLYKKGIPSMFVDTDNNKFLGIIKGISAEGKLQVELENEYIREFDLKEIKFKNFS